MSDIKLGELIPDAYGVRRDAVHMALCPVEAGEVLSPGDKLVFRDRRYSIVKEAGDGENRVVGIVDPYLTRDVQKGEYFWMLVKPGMISQLRHEWSHEDFPDPENGLDYDDGCRGCY